MSTTYLNINAVQRPFPFNVDENGRVMFSSNFTAQAHGDVDSWEQELRKLIVTAGLGTAGTDLFIGPDVTLPVGDGPYIQIIDTGGAAPFQAHGANGSLYERLSAQIVVRGAEYLVTRDRALAIWRTLHGVRNQTVAA